jgi:hypothetical protein
MKTYMGFCAHIQYYSINIGTVKPLYNGHAWGRKNVRNRGVSVKERGYYISTLRYGPKKSSVIEKFPQARGVRSERFHCIYN